MKKRIHGKTGPVVEVKSIGAPGYQIAQCSQLEKHFLTHLPSEDLSAQRLVWIPDAQQSFHQAGILHSPLA